MNKMTPERPGHHVRLPSQPSAARGPGSPTGPGGKTRNFLLPVLATFVRLSEPPAQVTREQEPRHRENHDQ